MNTNHYPGSTTAASGTFGTGMDVTSDSTLLVFTKVGADGYSLVAKSGTCKYFCFNSDGNKLGRYSDQKGYLDIYLLTYTITVAE